MDHVIFLAQERFEAVQLNFRSASSTLGLKFSGLRENVSESMSVTASVLGTSWSSLQGQVSSHHFSKQAADAVAQLRDSLDNFRPTILYDRFVLFVVHEVSRTHVYLCCACFLAGGLVGALLGHRMRSSVAAPQKMRAVVVNNYTGLEGISVVEDVSAPRLAARHQLLVQVRAAAIDSIDLMVARGYGRGMRRHLNRYNPNCGGEFPVVLGRDCAGVVVAVGADVEGFNPGDEVWLAVPLHHQGTLSEYIVVSAELACIKPAELSMEAAAALPFALMQAWGALHQAGVKDTNARGKRFLVHGGAGGVGVVLVQVCSAWGGHVTTTIASARHEQLVRMLGAHDVISCDAAPLEKELSLRDKFDIILNPAGAGLHAESLKHCLPDGLVVSTAMPRLPADTYGVVVGAVVSLYLRICYLVTKSRWVRGEWYGSVPTVTSDVLRAAAPLITSGRLQAVVDKAYNCQDAELAFQHIDRVQQVGKTVVRFSSSTPSRALQMAFWQDL